MLITKKIEIDMGHRVPGHENKCKNFHGHRWIFEVGVDDQIITTPGAPDEGMVLDFGELKKIMMKEIDEHLDHGFMMYDQDEYASDFKKYQSDGQKIIFVDFVPTSENISKYIFNILYHQLKTIDIRLHHVKIWETPNSTSLCTASDMPNLFWEN